jgi:hypothetical protein
VGSFFNINKRIFSHQGRQWTGIFWEDKNSKFQAKNVFLENFTTINSTGQ